jgi:site-specific DNA-methyltransferase (adenine-specific)/adenine-specific DNA-methyltransferase
MNVGCDSLFWYSKNPNTRFRPVIKSAGEHGKSYWHGFWKPSDRPTLRYEIFGIKPSTGQWLWKKERVVEAIKNYEVFLKEANTTRETLEEYYERIGGGKEFVRKEGNSSSVNSIKYWIPPREFILANTNWTDIPGYSFQWGYPTENSEQLLERVIRSSSKEGDILLDCFAGSGTTGAVAEKLGRKWIMCDIGKLAIYTIQKRMLNLKVEISNKGKALKPKPFVLYNAGLYLDSGFIEKMGEEDYKKFVLELFCAEPSEHKIKGVQFHGILNNRPVMVFSQKDYLTYEFIDDLHKTVGSGLKDEMYIIVPQGVVRFNEDYIDKRQVRYHILRVPYSIIQKILEKGFLRGRQPFSKADINQTIESVGFDFIYPPKVECEYYRGKEGELFDQLVIKIKKFEPVQISKKPVEFQDPKKEALSMVMIDKNYDGKVFDMDHYFFGDEIVKNDFKVVFPSEKAGEKIMIIYLDVLGNEKVEVKDIKDFKKK